MAKPSKPILAPIDQRMFQLLALLLEKETIRYQTEFCEAIGIDKRTLPNIRKGKQYFTRDHIKKACEAYGVNANWIFGLSEEMFREKAQIHFISQGGKAKALGEKEKRG